MTAPDTSFVAVGYQNPHAEDGLTLSLEVVPNTPQDIIFSNIRANSELYPDWLKVSEANDKPAVLIGGGASINDHVEDIRKLQLDGAIVFAMNAASSWARENRIEVDYQVILDAKEETSTLVDPFADAHLFSSQCHPKTTAAAENLTLWHFGINGIDELLPKGDYAIIGGESTVGICALCVAYTMGHRDLHVFGYDSSYRDGESHAYKQSINAMMPTTVMGWGGREFTLSIAMKRQAEMFQVYAQALKDVSATITVYGDGFLQSIYNTPVSELAEREKYQLLWQYDAYRSCSPGELIADFYLEGFKPDSRIVDYGCGTGRAGIKFAEAGLGVLLMDFTDNCRDKEALDLPFMRWDLTQPIPVKTEYGFCTDVMEHIPTDDVDLVITNIMDSGKNVFFQISTVDDEFGGAIGAPLHLTVKPHNWWKDRFKELGYNVDFAQNLETASMFHVKNSDY